MKRIIAVLLTVVIILGMLVTANAEEVPGSYTDVPSNSVYYKAVKYVSDKGYMIGTGKNTFSPDLEVSRAMLVTVLYRCAGNPVDFDLEAVRGVFTDVGYGKWYEVAVYWAYSKGIVTGTSDNQFSPDIGVTLQDCCVMLYRYSKKYLNNYDTSYNANDCLFTDLNTLSNYAKDGVGWALHNYLIEGVSETVLSPKRVLTRGQVAQVVCKAQCITSTHKWNLGYTKEATCEQTGYSKYSCTVCGATKYENVVRAPGHNYVNKVDTAYLKSAASCTSAAKYYCSCSNCGKRGSNTFTDGSALGHDYSKVELVSDATTSAPTKYKFVCFRCGSKTAVRSLGKPITNAPVLVKGNNVPYDVLQWGSGTAPKSKVLYEDSNGTKVTLTRKWFASAWCYIADIRLKPTTYKNFTGVSTYNPKTNSITPITAYNKINNMSNAVVLVSGDGELYNEWGNLRGNVAYDSKVQAYTSAPAHYWNPSNGTFGALKDLGLDNSASAVSMTSLRSAGITDTIRWGVPWIKNGRLLTNIVDGNDCEQSTYTQVQQRRQRTFMGFKKSGSTVHVYLVVSEGSAYTNQPATQYSWASTDKASYGLIGREEQLLMATLGCDFAFGLDGGGSSSIACRYNGKTYQVNGVCDPGEPYARPVWDFFGFIK